MAGGNNPQFNAKNISATANGLSPTFGTMGGIFVSSASSTPTITIYDGLTSGGTKIVDTFTPVSAAWYAFPFCFQIGLTVVISGTVSATVFWA